MSAIETMSTARLWAHVAAVAVATYALRASFIGSVGYYDMPDAVEERMTLVPPAVLSALALPPLFYRDGAFHLSPGNPFLLAGLAGAVVAWRTENLVGTIAAGFLTYLLVVSVP